MSETIHTTRQGLRQSFLGGPKVWLAALIFVVGLGGLWAFTLGWFAPTPKIALITSAETPYWDLVETGARDAAKQFGADLQFIRCKPDVAAQNAVVQNLLSQGISGVGISPVNPSEQKAVLEQIASKSRLVTFDSDAPDSKRIAYVGTDNYLAGWTAGDEVMAAESKGGSVALCVGSVSKPNGQDRRIGLIDNLLAKHFHQQNQAYPLDQVAKGDNYSVVATIVENGDHAAAVQSVRATLTKYPDLKCLVGLYASSTSVILEALQAENKLGKVSVIGFDESNELQAGITDGTVHSSILQEQYMCGFETVRFLAENTKTTEEWSPAGPVIRTFGVHILDKDSMAGFRAEKRLRTPTTK